MTTLAIIFPPKDPRYRNKATADILIKYYTVRENKLTVSDKGDKSVETISSKI